MEFAVYGIVTLLVGFPLSLIGVSYSLSIRVDDLKDFDEMLPVLFLSILFTLIWPLMLVFFAVGWIAQKAWRYMLTYLVPYSPPKRENRKWWYEDLKHLRELEAEMREATSAASTPDEIRRLLQTYYRKPEYDYGIRETLSDLRIRILDERIAELEQTR